MSAASGDILTREEMAALLDSLAAARSDDEVRTRFLSGGSGGRPDGDPKVRAAFERAIESLGRQLSATFQTRIRCHVVGVEELALTELEELVSGTEQLVTFGLAGSETPGVVVVGRSLFFDWLNRTLGGSPGERVEVMGSRAYTVIEQRMLRRLVGDWLSVIGAHLPGDEERKPRIRGIEPARALGDWPGARVVFWSVEVEGLGELGRLRLAWPLDALTRPVEPAKARGPAPGDPLHGLLLDAPVVLCAEVGTADVSLSRLAGLEVGDVLPIDVRDDGRLIVRIEGRPKFDAIRGAVGNRAAIQIVGCRAASGGEQRG